MSVASAYSCPGISSGTSGRAGNGLHSAAGSLSCVREFPLLNTNPVRVRNDGSGPDCNRGVSRRTPKVLSRNRERGWLSRAGAKVFAGHWIRRNRAGSRSLGTSLTERTRKFRVFSSAPRMQQSSIRSYGGAGGLVPDSTRGPGRPPGRGRRPPARPDGRGLPGARGCARQRQHGRRHAPCAGRKGRARFLPILSLPGISSPRSVG
jgi:hypothetical protein